VINEGTIPYLISMVILLIGLYAILAKGNVVKIIVGVLIAEYAVNLFLLLLGYRKGGRFPIVLQSDIASDGTVHAQFVEQAVDPVPQALILTSIVIGLAVVGMMVALALRIYDRYGTFDITRIRRLKG
jgi:multicomponent Na+:H+ antiporter subunit C